LEDVYSGEPAWAKAVIYVYSDRVYEKLLIMGE
jgi:hypothetical protein